MSHADMSHTDLRFTGLQGANMCRVNLYSADLYFANLSFAKMRRADMSHVKNIDKALNLDKAYWNKHTRIDDKFRDLLGKKFFMEGET